MPKWGVGALASHSGSGRPLPVLAKRVRDPDVLYRDAEIALAHRNFLLRSLRLPSHRSLVAKWGVEPQRLASLLKGRAAPLNLPLRTENRRGQYFPLHPFDRCGSPTEK